MDHVITDSGFTLGEGFDLAGISLDELYVGYRSIGGSASIENLLAHLRGDAYGDDNEHNLIAQALNEVFLNHGRELPVAYRNLRPPPDRDEN